MAVVTRVNGLNCTVGTLFNLNANAFLITVKNAGASAIDLRAEDDAVDEAVEQIVKELNPVVQVPYMWSWIARLVAQQNCRLEFAELA